MAGEMKDRCIRKIVQNVLLSCTAGRLRGLRRVERAVYEAVRRESVSDVGDLDGSTRQRSPLEWSRYRGEKDPNVLASDWLQRTAGIQ